MLTTSSSTVSNGSINCIRILKKFQIVSANNPRLYLLYNSKIMRNQCLQTSTTSSGFHVNNIKKNCRYMAIYAGVDPGPIASPDPSSVPWKLWIVGMLISAILPFWKIKFWPLIKLKDRVESMVETAEELADTVEKVAEGVEKVAEEVADYLPESGKLHKAAIFVEDVAKQTAHDAHLVSELIDKVEEVEKKAESLIEAAMDDATDIINETKDQPSL